MTDVSFEVEIPSNLAGDGKEPCNICGKMVTERGMTRHMNSAHGESGEQKTKRRLGGGRTRKTKGLTAEVSDGLASVAGKFLFLLTLILAWSQLRRANIPDPSGDFAEQLAMSDEEATAIGRPLARIFGSTSVGRRVAPSIVENEDMIDAVFAGWEWYKRNADFWREVHPQAVQEPTMTATRERVTHGRNGQTPQDRSESEAPRGPEYIGPSPIDLLGA